MALPSPEKVIDTLPISRDLCAIKKPGPMNTRIVLQGTGDPQVFTSIASAVATAQPNDKPCNSGGTFTTGDGGITVDKPLHWIDAGISPDSTHVTALSMLRIVNGNITFTTGAGDSTFTIGMHCKAPKS